MRLTAQGGAVDCGGLSRGRLLGMAAACREGLSRASGCGVVATGVAICAVGWLAALRCMSVGVCSGDVMDEGPSRRSSDGGWSKEREEGAMQAEG